MWDKKQFWVIFGVGWDWWDTPDIENSKLNLMLNYENARQEINFE